MAAPQDKDYAKACGQLASALSISIASARRKVDLVAAKEGVRDNEGRLLIVQRLLVKPRAWAKNPVSSWMCCWRRSKRRRCTSGMTEPLP